MFSAEWEDDRAELNDQESSDDDDDDIRQVVDVVDDTALADRQARRDATLAKQGRSRHRNLRPDEHDEVLVFDAPYENIGGSDICVDAAGEYVVIGARRGLMIIDLQSPYQPIKTLRQQSKDKRTKSQMMSRTVVQWHTNIAHRDYLASSTSKNVLVWNLEAGASPLEATLQQHSRIITDFAWSPLSPTAIASSDSGGTINLWDLRASGKRGRLVHSFHTSAAGMAQLEWNRFD